MKLVIDIPRDFECHFNNDKFKDSLERIECDIRDDINNEHTIPVISGLWELELIDMLIEAFKNAEIRKVGHWISDGYIDMCCSECDHESGMTPEATDYCPYCGAEMI